MKKSFGRIPTWQMFKENFSPSQENEESFDDLDTAAPAEGTEGTEGDEAPLDGDGAEGAAEGTEGDDVPAEGGISDEVKAKILDLKDQIESSEDEFTKEDFLKALDEISASFEPAAEEDAAEGEGEGEGDEAPLDGDDAEGAEGDDVPAEGSAEELSESKKAGVAKKVVAPKKVSVPEAPKAVKHKKADVTGKVTSPAAAATAKPSKK